MILIILSLVLVRAESLEIGPQVANYAVVGHNTWSGPDSGHAIHSREPTMVRQSRQSLPEFSWQSNPLRKTQLSFPCWCSVLFSDGTMGRGSEYNWETLGQRRSWSRNGRAASCKFQWRGGWGYNLVGAYTSTILQRWYSLFSDLRFYFRFCVQLFWFVHTRVTPSRMSMCLFSKTSEVLIVSSDGPGISCSGCHWKRSFCSATICWNQRSSLLFLINIQRCWHYEWRGGKCCSWRC